MRKTKIICTLGPSTDDENVLKSLVKAGMNVARLNFSHGTHSEHFEKLDLIGAGVPVEVVNKIENFVERLGAKISGKTKKQSEPIQNKNFKKKICTYWSEITIFA